MSHRSDKEEYRGWLNHVEQTCKKNMSKFLLIKDPETGLLSVNLDSSVSSLQSYNKCVHKINQICKGTVNLPSVCKKKLSSTELYDGKKSVLSH